MSNHNKGSELPPNALALVFSFLEGDTPTLCAAACVSKAWKAAASVPSVWQTLALGLPTNNAGGSSLAFVKLCDDTSTQARRAKSVTGARLRAFLGKAGPSLVSLRLDGCSALSDADLLCLTDLNAPYLSEVGLRGCAELSARGVLAALKGRSLSCLRVDGLSDYDGGGASEDEDEDIIKLFRRIVAPSGLLDVKLCCGECERLVRGLIKSSCGFCEEATPHCAWCAKHANAECGHRHCRDCRLSYTKCAKCEEA